MFYSCLFFNNIKRKICSVPSFELNSQLAGCQGCIMHLTPLLQLCIFLNIFCCQKNLDFSFQVERHLYSYRFYNRKTIAAFNCEISFKPPLPYMQINTPFLNSRISVNHDKVQRLSAKVESLIKGLFLYCRIS